MKCPICKEIDMEKVRDSIEQDGVAFEAYKCPKCKEEIMTMGQLKILARKYRELRRAKEVKFSRWGNSIAVRIPNEFIEEYNIKEGKPALITSDRKAIKIIPQFRRRVSGNLVPD